MSNRQNAQTRRDLLKNISIGGVSLAAGVAGGWGATSAPWVPAVAARLAHGSSPRHCILLWMNGGPSQTDTFDMKPGHPHGGEFKETATSVPGLRFSEHLPLLAQHAERLAIIRSLSTKEGDHARGAHLVRTGRSPGGDVAYPSIACSLAQQLTSPGRLLPHYVSVAPQQQLSPAAFGPGFLGARYAPALVGGSGTPLAQGIGHGEPLAELRLENLESSENLAATQIGRRQELWNVLQRRLLDSGEPSSLASHDAIYRKAIDMMRPEVRNAFDLTQEPEKTRRLYGGGTFGQGCLLARRLIERGVGLVEVSLGDGLAWDTHQDNFTQVKLLSQQLDAGWATLMVELDERGLLDSTTIVWLGEFGRTPAINASAGRDHFPQAWSCVLGGGGIAGGQTFGRTSSDGTTIDENKVEIGDVLATLCRALEIDPLRENVTPTARPIKLAEGKPIEALLS